jgi:5-methylcytosine-specific restriction endonuclease McrA
MFDDITLEEINSLVCDIDGCNTPTPTGRVCGTHQARARKMYRLLKGAKSVPLNMEEIFERDGWICGICNLPTLREDLQGGYHPMMPVLDHIVARAAGGDSTPENVQTAHHACNSFKQDLDERELAFREQQTFQAMDLLGQGDWDA